MLNDISNLLWDFINFGLNMVFLLYQILERILPAVLFYSGSHAWWHNLISVVGWISLYIFLARKYHEFSKWVKNRLSVSAWERRGFVLFPWWNWVCYALAPALYLAASHYGWDGWIKLLAAPLLAAPPVRLLIKGGAGFPLLLLYHLAIIATMGVYAFVFMPIAVLVLLLAGVALVMQAATPTKGDISAIERRPCPVCGQSGRCSHR